MLILKKIMIFNIIVVIVIFEIVVMFLLFFFGGIAREEPQNDFLAAGSPSVIDNQLTTRFNIEVRKTGALYLYLKNVSNIYSKMDSPWEFNYEIRNSKGEVISKWTVDRYYDYRWNYGTGNTFRYLYRISYEILPSEYTVEVRFNPAMSNGIKDGKIFLVFDKYPEFIVLYSLRELVRRIVPFASGENI